MILTEYYKNNGNVKFTQIVHDIFAKHGVSGFFIGVIARLMHVSSIITSQLVIYDVVKMALGLQASGAH